jgi:deazaflavin-dependent oxidoreductase (nitroreductase family)
MSRSQKFGNKMIEFLNKLGIGVGPMQILRVKGRKSGKEYTNPVAPVKIDGTLYVLQAFPESSWVKNVRAAGEGTLTRGRKSQRVRLVEVPPAERAAIAEVFPAQVPAGVSIFVKNGVVADKTPASFVKAAPGIPIFRVIPIA